MFDKKHEARLKKKKKPKMNLIKTIVTCFSGFVATFIVYGIVADNPNI